MRTISVDEIIENKNIVNNYQPKKNIARIICLRMFNKLKSAKYVFTENKPIKQYELYKINLDKEVIMLANSEWLTQDTHQDKELYYDKDIALQICEICNQLDDSAINSCPEIMELYQDEIYMKQEELENLKKKDEEKYKNAVNEFNIVTKSDIYKYLKNEILLLNYRINKDNEVIKKLEKKLDFSMKKYEETRNLALTEYKESIFKKFINKIKVIFHIK